jgi:hypothetical protein
MATTDEEYARQALERAAAGAPPMSLDLSRQLALGARRRRARRWGAGAATVACVAVLGVGGLAAAGQLGAGDFGLLVGGGVDDEHAPGDGATTASTSPSANPQETPGWYGTGLEELFQEHPDEWGGAYYVDNTLHVNSVTRTIPEAEALLQGLGLPDGFVVTQAGPPISEYIRAAQALEGDDELATLVTNVSGDYEHAALVIDVRSGADQAAVNQRITDVLNRIGSPLPVYDVNWGDPTPVWPDASSAPSSSSPSSSPAAPTSTAAQAEIPGADFYRP